MLMLLAYAPDERWAYVQEGDRCFLLRPPYHQDLAVHDADVERAVTVHGYATSDRTFATRRALFDFLLDESVRVWRLHNPPVDPASLRARLLDVLSVDDLDRHITRALGKVHQGRAPEALALLDRLGTATALTLEQRQRIGAMRDDIRARTDEESRQRLSALRAELTTRFTRARRSLGASNVTHERSALRPAA